MIKLDTFLLLVAVAALILVACSGCEARKFVAHRSDGTVITYERATLLGDSSSEGVSVAKQGEDLTVDVGPTNSSANVQQAIDLLNAIK